MGITGTITFCNDCRVQMGKVLSLLETACSGTCSDTIISDYLCSSVQTMSGGGNCDHIDLMHYIVDNMQVTGNEYGSYYGDSGMFNQVAEILNDMEFWMTYEGSSQSWLGNDGYVNNEMDPF